MADVLEVPADVANLAKVRQFVRQAARGRLDRSVIEDLVCAVDEAVTNVIVHGYDGDPGSVEIEAGGSDERLEIRIADRAPRFDPTTVPERDINIPLEDRPRGGMGVRLMRDFADEIRYTPRRGGGNEVTLVKRLDRAGGGHADHG
jgi:anti-sigma regulatory factor (Ser/Thr protein kinase)